MEGLELQAVYRYLDQLREAGVVNMFGATSYLMDHFDVSKKVATKLLVDWMTDYSIRHPDTEKE